MGIATVTAAILFINRYTYSRMKAIATMAPMSANPSMAEVLQAAVARIVRRIQIRIRYEIIKTMAAENRTIFAKGGAR